MSNYNYPQGTLGNSPPQVPRQKPNKTVYIILCIICYPLSVACGIAGFALFGCLYLAALLLEGAVFLVGAIAGILFLVTFVVVVMAIFAFLADPSGGFSILKDLFKMLGWVLVVAAAVFLLATVLMWLSDFFADIPGKYYGYVSPSHPNLTNFARSKFGDLKSKMDTRGNSFHKPENRSQQARRQQTYNSTSQQNGYTDEQPTGYQPVNMSSAYSPFNNGYNRYPSKTGRR